MEQVWMLPVSPLVSFRRKGETKVQTMAISEMNSRDAWIMLAMEFAKHFDYFVFSGRQVETVKETRVDILLEAE